MVLPFPTNTINQHKYIKGFMMNQNTVFMKWWIQSVVIIFAAIMIQHLGWWEALWNADQTKISVGIIGIFILTTGTTGFISKHNTKEILEKYQNYVWFASEAMITLGMIGTVAGFLMMLGTAFANIDVSNTQVLQTVISDMAIGMSTALSTTLVGLICSVLVKFQMVVIENSWEEDAPIQ